jgi:hypothetical protein
MPSCATASGSPDHRGPARAAAPARTAALGPQAGLPRLARPGSSASTHGYRKRRSTSRRVGRTCHADSIRRLLLPRASCEYEESYILLTEPSGLGQVRIEEREGHASSFVVTCDGRTDRWIGAGGRTNGGRCAGTSCGRLYHPHRVSTVHELERLQLLLPGDVRNVRVRQQRVDHRFGGRQRQRERAVDRRRRRRPLIADPGGELGLDARDVLDGRRGLDALLLQVAGQRSGSRRDDQGDEHDQPQRRERIVHDHDRHVRRVAGVPPGSPCRTSEVSRGRRTS